MPASKWVHPRVCGGNRGALVHDGFYQGTSPRVRGKRQGDTRPERGDGYIPACAGGNLLTVSAITSLMGTSPRVRGKPRSW